MHNTKCNVSTGSVPANSDKTQSRLKKIKMNNSNDYCQNFQKAAQEKSFVESLKQYKEWETNLTWEWGNQKDQITSIMVKLSEA